MHRLVEYRVSIDSIPRRATVASGIGSGYRTSFVHSCHMSTEPDQWIPEEQAILDYGRKLWPLMKQGLWPGATVTCKSTDGDGHTSYI